MNLLSIFHTGGVTTMLTIVAAGLCGWFWYQMYSAKKDRKTVYYGQPYTKNPLFWFSVVVAVAYVIALLIVASDYKGV